MSRIFQVGAWRWWDGC